MRLGTGVLLDALFTNPNKPGQVWDLPLCWVEFFTCKQQVLFIIYCHPVHSCV